MFPAAIGNILSRRFDKEKPFTDLEKTIFRTAIEPNLIPGGCHSILHLKSQHENDAAVDMSDLLQERLPKNIIVDDPSESPVQTLTWYGSRVFGCNGLVCHFTDPKREGAETSDRATCISFVVWLMVPEYLCSCLLKVILCLLSIIVSTLNLTVQPLKP